MITNKVNWEGVKKGFAVWSMFLTFVIGVSCAIILPATIGYLIFDDIGALAGCAIGIIFIIIPAGIVFDNMIEGE